MYLITRWFGTFLCNEKNIKDKILFPKDPEKIAKRLIKIDKKEILSEEEKIAKNTDVTVNEKRLEVIGTYNPEDLFFENIKIEPKDFGFSQELIHEASIILAEIKVKKNLKSEDLQIVQMVDALDDLIQASNLLSERIDCWSIVPTPMKKIQPFEKVFSSVNREITRLE